MTAARGAKAVEDYLTRHRLVSRVQVSGQIRRQCEEVDRIDIIAIPRAVLPPDYQSNLDGERAGWVGENGLWVGIRRFVRSGAMYYRQEDLRRKEHHLIRSAWYNRLHLPAFFWMAKEERCWGTTIALSTGPVEYADTIRQGIRNHGFTLTAYNSIVSRNGVIGVRTEFKVFKLLSMKWVHPRDRAGVALK